MSVTYQQIQSINITSNSEFTSQNSQIDSTGKINEKIAANKFNYVVDTITPESETPTADLIFQESTVSGNKVYTLKRKVSGTYEQYNVPLSSTVLVTDPALQDIYTLFSIASTSPFTQTWIKTDIFNDSLPLHLTYHDTSSPPAPTLQTDGGVVVNHDDLEVADGSISASDTITAGNGITATAGGITATAGNITATAGNITTTAGSIISGSSITAATTITADGAITGSSLTAANNGTITGGSITATTQIQTPILLLPINTA